MQVGCQGNPFIYMPITSGREQHPHAASENSGKMDLDVWTWTHNDFSYRSFIAMLHPHKIRELFYSEFKGLQSQNKKE